MDRAYSVLELKEVSKDSRRFKGIATTPSPDRMGDIIDSIGAKYALPIPLLSMHDSSQPIGHVDIVKIGKSGINIEAQIADIPEPGVLKDRIEAAWQEIKYKLVRGLSIGFKPLEYVFMDSGGVHFKSWEWLELSAVTIPANSEASITSIKNFDRKSLAALGIPREPVRLLSPGVSGFKASRLPGGAVPLINRSK